ncbi:MAG: ATP-binding cassette domain-containing protein [Gammaproteobacteria bacterium]|nr:ATP-binding cassette domain-containing protein [Gammaproteobacteria bacterium]
MIVAEGVRHVYRGGRVALDEVSLSIGTGLFGLLGSNGAGKSTLMRILCTLLAPTAGTVRVGGRDVLRERTAVRRLLGYLPQEFGAWRLQRVAEVVDSLAALSGMSDRTQRQRRVAEVLDSVGLGKVADRKVKQLSGGMLRRLGVAQALVHEPRVLIVDEPTVGLDPEERLRFRQLMADLGRDRTVVLSTHIVADLGSGCADLAIIDHGKVRFRGAPTELLREAHDKVFEITVPVAAEGALLELLEIVRRVANGGMLQLRGVLRGSTIPAGATPVADITLEEAYLAFMLPHGLVVEETAP